MADGITVPGGLRVIGMFAAVEEYLAIRVDVAFEKHHEQRRRLHDLPWIRRLTGNARGEAVCFGVVLRHALLRQVRRPRLKGELFAGRERCGDVVYKGAV